MARSFVRETGVDIQVLEPGQPSCKYHSESVLAGRVQARDAAVAANDESA